MLPGRTSSFVIYFPELLKGVDGERYGADERGAMVEHLIPKTTRLKRCAPRTAVPQGCGELDALLVSHLSYLL